MKHAAHLHLPGGDWSPVGSYLYHKKYVFLCTTTYMFWSAKKMTTIIQDTHPHNKGEVRSTSKRTPFN